jgi:hypothetical protein
LLCDLQWAKAVIEVVSRREITGLKHAGTLSNGIKLLKNDYFEVSIKILDSTYCKNFFFGWKMNTSYTVQCQPASRCKFMNDFHVFPSDEKWKFKNCLTLFRSLQKPLSQPFLVFRGQNGLL